MLFAYDWLAKSTATTNNNNTSSARTNMNSRTFTMTPSIIDCRKKQERPRWRGTVEEALKKQDAWPPGCGGARMNQHHPVARNIDVQVVDGDVDWYIAAASILALTKVTRLKKKANEQPSRSAQFHLYVQRKQLPGAKTPRNGWLLHKATTFSEIMKLRLNLVR